MRGGEGLNRPRGQTLPELWKNVSRSPLEAPKAGEFSIGHIVSSKAAVDGLLSRAAAAGATITDRAHDRPWGIYSGYFQDLDGHLWEIIWNPRTGSSG